MALVTLKPQHTSVQVYLSRHHSYNNRSVVDTFRPGSACAIRSSDRPLMFYPSTRTDFAKIPSLSTCRLELTPVGKFLTYILKSHCYARQ